MKKIIVLLLIFPLFINAQKAKSTSLKSSYHYIRYAISEVYNAPIYGLTITEQSSCGGLVPYKVMKTPLVSPDPRTRLYVNSLPTQPKNFSQARDIVNNLIAKHTPFTHFEVGANNIVLAKQITKNAKKMGPDYPEQFYLEFHTSVPVKVKATFHGNTPMQTLDTNSVGQGVKTMRFPMDVQFGKAAPDILMNGYPTEAALIKAWTKYGKKAQVQWRDKAIESFLVPVFFNYKKKHISYEEFDQLKIYSDKNKKGGYEELVHTAEKFISTLNKIEGDYQLGKFKKYWTAEHQVSFKECNQVWKNFLTTNGMDLTKGNGNVPAEYKQKIFLNYLYSLTFTAQFEEAERLISENVGKKLKSGILTDIERMRVLNTYMQKEFAAHSRSKEWVKG